MPRLEQIDFFYEILQDLEDKLGGKRRLASCHGRMRWPQRGVYFFFEPGEKRSSGSDSRVVRVGTHALKRGSKSTLWKRLRAHRGTLKGKRPGGGNHRGSIFRLHVGSAILHKEGLEDKYPTWGVGSSAPTEIRDHEYPIEKKVSQHIREMPFLWVEVEDPPGPQSQRAYIERNSIALLSNYGKLGTPAAIDPPSPDWLGFHCASIKVCRSGFWNADHVAEQQWDNGFLNILQQKVKRL
jgi:hypothetical protein